VFFTILTVNAYGFNYVSASAVRSVLSHEVNRLADLINRLESKVLNITFLAEMSGI